jgi:hypothetical protein
MINLLGNFLKVLIEKNDKLDGITTLGFKICKNNIIRGDIDKRKKGSP